MSENKIIEYVNNFIEKNDFNLSEVEFKKIENKDEYLEIYEIKDNPFYLAHFFVILYDSFSFDFLNVSDKKINDLITKNEEFVIKLRELKNNCSKKVEFGKNASIRKLNEYINDNYNDIINFFDLCVALYKN